MAVLQPPLMHAATTPPTQILSGPSTQESFGQPKPNKGRFASGSPKTGYSCEFGVISLENQRKFTKVGANREFGFCFSES